MADDSPVRLLDDEPEFALTQENESDMEEEELLETRLPIGDVAKSVGVNASVLRFWEQEFPQLKPAKRGNRRYYGPEDVKLIHLIQHLLYKEGYTILGARNKIHELQVKQKVNECLGENLPVIEPDLRKGKAISRSSLEELKRVRNALVNYFHLQPEVPWKDNAQPITSNAPSGEISFPEESRKEDSQSEGNTVNE